MEQFNTYVDIIFWYCVDLLKIWGNWTGLGYNLINIIIFVFLQPFLIALFFILWIRERSGHRKLKRTVGSDASIEAD